MLVRVMISLMAATLVTTAACNKNTDSDSDGADSDDGDDDSGQLGSLAIAENALAAAYPEGMALSAYPATVDSDPGAAGAGTIQVGATALVQNPPPPADEFKPFEHHPKEKLAHQQERLNGEAVKCFNPGILHALNFQDNSVEVCFGFDYGIVSGPVAGTVDKGQVNTALNNQENQSTAGILNALKAAQGFTADTSGEVCMVGTGRRMVTAAAAKVEAALEMFEGLFCQAKKSGLTTALPDTGTSIDLVTAFDSFDNNAQNPITFAKASIARLADANGRAVFKTEVEYTMTNAGQTRTSNHVLVHSPGAEGNSTYSGVLYSTNDRKGEGGVQNDTFTVATSVRYEKSGTTAADQRLSMEIRRVDKNTTKVATDVLDANGVVNYNAGADADGNFGPGQSNDYITNIGYFAFDVNPSSYAGNISFWTNPGGNFTEPARGFVSNTEQTEEGTLKGCAYVGAVLGKSIRKSVADGIVLKPDGCFTPRHSNGVCGGPNNNQGSQVWRQCFAQNSEGVYVVDTDATIDDATGFDILQSSDTDRGNMPTVDVYNKGGAGEVREK